MRILKVLAHYPQEVSRALGLLNQLELEISQLHYRNTKWFSKSQFEEGSFRAFSQSNEDGLLTEILKSSNIPSPGVFIEVGMGDGTENNTLLLLLSGWNGVWVGGEKLKIDIEDVNTISFLRRWIKSSNFVSIVEESVAILGTAEVDVFSLDLDGNDYHLAEMILERGFRPKIWVQEYNAVFGPVTEWIMPLNDQHKWNHDNYFGASYMAYVRLFERFEYKPVACSANGANVFFVHNSAGVSITSDHQDLWRPPTYISTRNGHPTSARLLRGL